MTEAPIPTRLSKKGDTAVLIEWNDGFQQAISWSTLRSQCPCASCREEREQPQPLLPVLTAAQAQPAKPMSMAPVGRYAYQIEWNDGHNSGIYTFEFLRSLGDGTEKDS